MTSNPKTKALNIMKGLIWVALVFCSIRLVDNAIWFWIVPAAIKLWSDDQVRGVTYEDGRKPKSDLTWLTVGVWAVFLTILFWYIGILTKGL